MVSQFQRVQFITKGKTKACGKKVLIPQTTKKQRVGKKIGPKI